MSDDFIGDFELSNHSEGLWNPGGCWLPTQSQYRTDWVESPTVSVLREHHA